MVPAYARNDGLSPTARAHVPLRRAHVPIDALHSDALRPDRLYARALFSS